MRDIKFRVWDKDFNKMVMVHDARFVNGLMIGAKGVNWDSKTEIMQYTGLKDKNGKDIYEADILKRKQPEVPAWHMENSTMLLEVRWDNDGCGFYLQRIKEYGMGPANFDGRWAMGTSSYDEIIGNIYEDGELLEDKP